MMHKKWQAVTEALAEQGYAIIENCFELDLIHQLRQDCFNASSRFKPALIGHQHDKHRNLGIRGDLTLWLDEPYSHAEQGFLSEMETLRQYINQALFLGLFDYEVHYAEYPTGTFYKKHLDQFRNNNLRQVTTLCYLNEAWRQEDGGALLIYGPQDQVIQSILPKENTFVCFLSDQFFHEVLPASRTRLSLSGWFRKRMP